MSSRVLCSALVLSLCIAAAPASRAQITTFGPFTPTTATFNFTGTGTGSSSGGTGSNLVSLGAESTVTQDLGGSSLVTRGSTGSVTVGPNGAWLEITSRLNGQFDVESVLGIGDGAAVDASVTVAGEGMTNVHAFSQTAVGTSNPNDIVVSRVSLLPGVHAITIVLTTSAVITDAVVPDPSLMNISDFEPGGFVVSLEEILSYTYCVSGLSANNCQAIIAASGQPSASAPSGFFLLASGVEGGKNGLFFYGFNDPQPGDIFIKPWGTSTSFHCMVPPVRRAAIHIGNGTLGACDGSVQEDINARWVVKPSHRPSAGSIMYAQYWYRDPFNVGNNMKSSLSNAIALFVTP